MTSFHLHFFGIFRTSVFSEVMHLQMQTRNLNRGSQQTKGARHSKHVQRASCNTTVDLQEKTEEKRKKDRNLIQPLRRSFGKIGEQVHCGRLIGMRCFNLGQTSLWIYNSLIDPHESCREKCFTEQSKGRSNAHLSGSLWEDMKEEGSALQRVVRVL